MDEYHEWLRNIFTWPESPVVCECKLWLPGDHYENRKLPMLLRDIKAWRHWENRRLPMRLEDV